MKSSSTTIKTTALGWKRSLFFQMACMEPWLHGAFLPSLAFCGTHLTHALIKSIPQKQTFAQTPGRTDYRGQGGRTRKAGSTWNVPIISIC